MVRSAMIAAVIILLVTPHALPAQEQKGEPNLRRIADDTKFQNALMFVNLKNYDRALVELNEYLEVFVSGSHRREAHARIGAIHFERFDYRRAMKAYRALYEEFSGTEDGTEAHYRIGLCYQKMGRDAKAIAIFKRIIGEHPDSESAAKAKTQLDILEMMEKETATDRPASATE